MLVKGAKEQHTHTKFLDCDELQLTNGQCHMVPTSILWYRKSWTIQLKYIFETEQDGITVSYHPTHHHGHTDFWYVCLLERAYFNYLEDSYYTHTHIYIYIYIINGVYGPKPRSSGGNTSSNPQVTDKNSLHIRQIFYWPIFCTRYQNFTVTKCLRCDLHDFSWWDHNTSGKLNQFYVC